MKKRWINMLNPLKHKSLIVKMHLDSTNKQGCSKQCGFALWPWTNYRSTLLFAHVGGGAYFDQVCATLKHVHFWIVNVIKLAKVKLFRFVDYPYSWFVDPTFDAFNSLIKPFQWVIAFRVVVWFCTFTRNLWLEDWWMNFWCAQKVC